MVIMIVGQEYESMESRHDYKTSIGTIFGGRGAPMDIGKSRNNFDERGKPRCFNCNIFRHMARECKKPKKDKETRKYYRCNKEGHLAKDCNSKQLMKNRRSQIEESGDKEEGFIKGLE